MMTQTEFISEILGFVLQKYLRDFRNIHQPCSTFFPFNIT